MGGAVDGRNDFHLQREPANGDWLAATQTSANYVPYLDQSVPCGLVTYRVRAYRGDTQRYSDWSGETSATRSCLEPTAAGMSAGWSGPGDGPRLTGEGMTTSVNATPVIDIGNRASDAASQTRQAMAARGLCLTMMIGWVGITLTWLWAAARRRRRTPASRQAQVIAFAMRPAGVGLLALLALLLPTSVLAQPGQVVEYYHLDALGSVRVVTNEAGAVVARHDFLPFGEEWNPPSNAQEKKLFTGHERDAETGLDYFGARYHRPQVGRFTTVDPVYTWSENLVDPQRWNRYAYVRNNPLSWVDPDGRAIELLNGQSDLKVFQDLVGGDAAKSLYVNKIGNRSFLGIRGDVDGFRKLSDRASLVGMLIQDRSVIEFATTNADLRGWGGAVTRPAGAVGNENVRVEVNPSQLGFAQQTLSSNGPGRLTPRNAKVDVW